MTYGLDRASYNQGKNAQFDFTILDDAQPTLTSRGPGAVSMVDSNKMDMRKEKRMIAAIRRLTPDECVRLQGFPDGWLDIGAWVDSKGKTHKESDTPKYKAIGNSLCLPFWHYLMSNLSVELRQSGNEIPTLGSLFDGIGGFPRVFEMVNGKGTALWASEIEDYPIAVTKIRFPEDERKE